MSNAQSSVCQQWAFFFFILLVLKLLRGEKKTHTVFRQKRRKVRFGSHLQQNEYMLLSTDHLSSDYNRPQGNWCWL